MAFVPLLAAAAQGDNTAPVSITVQEDTASRIVLHYELGDSTTETVTIDGQKYAQIVLGRESHMKVTGAPALPNVCRSIIIPDDAEMAVNVLESSYTEIAGIDIVPSKGVIIGST